MTRKKNFNNKNTASCNCDNETIRIQHYLEINLIFDDGNGYIDSNTHTFPISVAPLLSAMNKEEATTATTKCASSSSSPSSPSSSFPSNNKSTLHRDTSFDSTKSLNTSMSSNINSDDDSSNSSSSSSYTAASSLVYYSSSDEGFSKKQS